jgi:hypothetical protein
MQKKRNLPFGTSVEEKQEYDRIKKGVLSAAENL